MKQFLNMLDFMRKSASSTFSSCYGRDRAEGLADFWPLAEQCQPFVFSFGLSDFPLMRDAVGEVVHENFDAPFPVFSIEVLDGSLSVDVEKNGTTFNHKCILAWEQPDGSFSYIVFGTVTDPVTHISARCVFGKSETWDVVVAKYIKCINSCGCGTEKVRERVKIGTGNTKRTHTIRQVIHVRPKSQQPEADETSGRVIDWSHRWWCRGHWRSLPNTIGKNRDGVYCVMGKTWVTEHEVGPKDKPLIKKTRIVAPPTMELSEGGEIQSLKQEVKS